MWGTERDMCTNWRHLWKLMPIMLNFSIILTFAHTQIHSNNNKISHRHFLRIEQEWKQKETHSSLVLCCWSRCCSQNQQTRAFEQRINIINTTDQSIPSQLPTWWHPLNQKFTVTYVRKQALVSLDTIRSTRKINSCTIVCVPVTFFS